MREEYAVRIVKSLESIADSLEKLANPMIKVEAIPLASVGKPQDLSVECGTCGAPVGTPCYEYCFVTYEEQSSV